jgi:hypothetical protein
VYVVEILLIILDKKNKNSELNERTLMEQTQGGSVYKINVKWRQQELRRKVKHGDNILSLFVYKLKVHDIMLFQTTC